METLFWGSTFLLLYTFFGYPLLLRLLVKNKKQNEHLFKSGDLPSITVLLCIYNGSHLLKSRIHNILENGYPIEKIKIVIVSDGSTDEPQKEIDSLSLSNVELFHYHENKGKSYALNIGLEQVTTEIVVFADIRQKFSLDTIRNLVHCFQDKKIGAVSGNLIIEKDSNNGQSEPGLYWRYEKWIREKESKLSSLLGVTGAVYAARKKLIPSVPKNTLLDDMYIPLSMIKNGFTVKFVKNAIAVDVSSSSIKEEYYRKVRTLAGNFQLLSLSPWLISPFHNPVFFQFFSHKLLRLVMPYSLILMLIATVKSDQLYLNVFAWLQLMFYGYSFICYTFNRKNIKLPLSGIALSFCSLNLAAFMAGWKYYFSTTQSLWKKH